MYRKYFRVKLVNISMYSGIKEVNEGTYRVYVSTSAGTKIIETEIDVRPRE
jgi:hypothetical protein